MYENIITKVEQIVEEKLVERINPFFVFLFSNDGESTNIICTGMPTYQKSTLWPSIPLKSMVWNPIALTGLDVTTDMLSNYEVFIGYIE